MTTLHPDVDLVKTDTTPEGAVNEVISSSAADTGDDMRYDGTSQYIYNLSTKRSQFCAQANSACSDGDLTAGSYRLTVSDPEIGSVSETFNLRSK